MSLSTNTPVEEVQKQQQPIDAKHLEHIAIHNPRRILFLYGSQTGCAQDVAENAAREARRMHFSATVSAMDDYDRVIIQERITIDLTDLSLSSFDLSIVHQSNMNSDLISLSPFLVKFLFFFSHS